MCKDSRSSLSLSSLTLFSISRIFAFSSVTALAFSSYSASEWRESNSASSFWHFSLRMFCSLIIFSASEDSKADKSSRLKSDSDLFSLSNFMFLLFNENFSSSKSLILSSNSSSISCLIRFSADFFEDSKSLRFLSSSALSASN